MQILLLTGACGVGKTTLAKAWAERKGGAIVECDYFTEWIFDPNFPHWSEEEERFTADLAATVAGKYLDAGMPVAIENVWSPNGLKQLKVQLLGQHEDLDLKAVWLHCDLEENRRRDALRRPENQMLDRVDRVRNELLDQAWPDFVQILDTTGLSVAHSLDQLENLPSIGRSNDHGS